MLQSRFARLALGGLLVLIGVLTQLEIRKPSLPAGSVQDILELRAREDINLLFILVDTLRADRLGCYGYSLPTSPIIDSLANVGVRFERVLAQSSWTKSSMASLWTATYPITNGVLRYPHALSTGATLPAEILREAGFRTAGIWRNGWVAPNFGFDQGFEIYQRPQPGARPHTLEQHNPSAHRLTGSDYDITRSALEFLKASGEERWFLYLHYMDVHQYVYERDSAKFGTSYSSIYDNSIHWVDRNIGVLLAQLERQDLLKKTLIVIASDHGEAFYEHDLEGHARNLYREVTETPLILTFPFRLEPSVVISTRVENIDVWPTILDFLGLEPIPGADGRSLVPVILAATRGDELEMGDGPAFAQLDAKWGRFGVNPDPIVAATVGDYRLIVRVNEHNASQLFNHSTDPWEQTNIAEQQPEVAAQLKEYVQDYLRRPSAPWRPLEVEIDELELGQLRALGYILR